MPRSWRSPLRALLCPASLKGVLTAADAATELAAGFRTAGIVADEQPVADGGEGSLTALQHARGGRFHEVEVPDAFGRPRRALWLELPNGTAVVEAAQAIPLDPERLDPLSASSEGLGVLIRATGTPRALLVCLGGTATVDGGARLGVFRLTAPTRVACDALVPLEDAARLFASQKGATPEQVEELARRLAAMEPLQRFARIPGAGAAGGLGARLASIGAKLVPGAALVLDELGFDPTGYDLVVTGEGTIDDTTATGKAPAEVARRCAAAGVRCVAFGGIVRAPIDGAETVPLSGDPARARDDLRELGALLGGAELPR